MTSVYSRDREDRNERPDLPVLIIVSNHREAEALQRRLHPAEFHVMGLGGPLMGHRFRMIQVCIGEWENRMRFAPSNAEMERVDDFLAHARSKLVPGCTQHFYRL